MKTKSNINQTHKTNCGLSCIFGGARQLLAFLLIIIPAIVLYGQTTYTTAQHGPWSSSSTWVGGIVPNTGWGNAIIVVNHNLTSAAFDVGGTVNLTVNGSLAVTGGINMWPSPVISGNGSISTTGDFKVAGTVNFAGNLTSGGSFTVAASSCTIGGALSIATYYTTYNTPAVVVNGPITTGTHLIQNGGSLTANAPVTIGTYLKLNTSPVVVFNSTLTVGTSVEQNGGQLTFNDETEVGSTFDVNGSGTLNVNGELDVTSDIALNASTMNIGDDAALSTSGNVTLNGTSSVSNEGELSSTNLTINGGTFDNSGSIETTGDFSMHGGSTFTNTSGSSTHTIDGNYTSQGTYVNNGSLDIGGNATNNAPHTIINNGDMYVAGDFTNTGNTENNGNLLVDGDVSNSGSIDGEGYICSTDNTDPTNGNLNGIDGQDICGESGPLPVNLLSFNIISEGKTVVVSWITATETNNSHFSIDLAMNSLNFETVKTVPGNGNSNAPLYYTGIIELPQSGIAYIRLRQTDYDGKSKVLGIRQVVYGDVEFNSQIFPNPVKAGQNVNIFTPEDAEVFLYDMQGRMLIRVASDSGHTLETSQLSTGMYLLRIQSAFGTQTEMLVVN